MNYPTQEVLRALGITVREHYDESGVTLQDARRIIDWHNAQAAKQEPVYQLKSGDGKWIDQAKHSYEYNAANGHEVRKLYAATMPAQAPGVIDYCFIKEVSDKYGLDYNKFCAAYRAMLAAAPAHPNATSDDAKDAARYRWLANYLPSDRTDCDDAIIACSDKADLDAAIDALKGGAA